MYVPHVLLHEISSAIDQWPVQCAQSLNVHFCVLVCTISQYVYVDSPSFPSFTLVSWSCKSDAVKVARPTGTYETRPC